MLDFRVDGERCTRCGYCVQDCPVRIIEMKDGALPSIIVEEEGDCMRCQHCLAVCPTGAVSIFGRNPDESVPLTPDALPSLDAVETLVRGRRSFRNYADANVEPALLDRILRALANAPTGVNKQELVFHLIDDKDAMQAVRVKVLRTIAKASEAGTLPKGAGYLASLAKRYFGGERDILFRGAPHAIIVTAPKDAPCPREDVALALAYFELLAQSAGLGTVWWGLLKFALESAPELKPLFGVGFDDEYYGMLFGVPSLGYVRTVQRDDGARVERLRPPTD
jgi:nitroreductase/NAD-dependent dihydropyrimidine dehydrogenase PreA subunit